MTELYPHWEQNSRRKGVAVRAYHQRPLSTIEVLLKSVGLVHSDRCHSYRLRAVG